MGGVFLFGEAEKGRLCTPYFLSTLSELFQNLGEPSGDSLGIYYAIQMLLFEHTLIFFRVEQEGFCRESYQCGIQFIRENGLNISLNAICLPGVGDRSILDAITPLCHKSKSLLIITESDLFDYLTSTH